MRTFYLHPKTDEVIELTDLSLDMINYLYGNTVGGIIAMANRSRNPKVQDLTKQKFVKSINPNLVCQLICQEGITSHSLQTISIYELDQWVADRRMRTGECE